MLFGSTHTDNSIQCHIFAYCVNSAGLKKQTILLKCGCVDLKMRDSVGCIGFFEDSSDKLLLSNK